MQAKELTLGGILTALTLIALYLTIIFKTNTLTLLTLASFMVPLGLIRGTLKTACLIYISSSLLCFLIVPINTALLYSLFFGLYGIIKYFIEKINHLYVELFLKLIFFNMLFFITLTLFQNLLGIHLFDPINQIISSYWPTFPKTVGFTSLWTISQVVFVLFDYALTLLIDYYMNHFHH
ncbi:MAG: hypothetical protein K0S30_2289 [Clostridia bacterium]|nr:hypothetical protein [Clostridia bacterium]